MIIIVFFDFVFCFLLTLLFSLTSSCHVWQILGTASPKSSWDSRCPMSDAKYKKTSIHHMRRYQQQSMKSKWRSRSVARTTFFIIPNPHPPKNPKPTHPKNQKNCRFPTALKQVGVQLQQFVEVGEPDFPHVVRFFHHLIVDPWLELDQSWLPGIFQVRCSSAGEALQRRVRSQAHSELLNHLAVTKVRGLHC